MKNLWIPCFLLASVLASCSQSSDTSQNNGGGNSVNWIIPAVGTEYVFQSTTQGLPKSIFDTLSILQTGQHIGDKTGVIGCLDKTGSAGTFFYNIENNGDLSYGDSTPNDAGGFTYEWTTFPTGSQKPIANPLVDTVEAGIPIFRSDVRTFVGAENLITAAGPLATLHVRETSINIIGNDSTLGCNASDTAVVDTWFAPSIGIYVKVVNTGTTDGVLDPQSEVDLIKYLPK
jgi:hypothetical protein